MSDEPFGRYLGRALEEQGVTQRELARRLAGDGATEREVESQRRWLQKILAPDAGVTWPLPTSVARIERALGVKPGYFPPRPQRLPEASSRDRLEELEARVLAQRQDLDDALAGVVLRLEAAEADRQRLAEVVERLDGRVAGLERGAPRSAGGNSAD